jgi:hypothetical protein
VDAILAICRSARHLQSESAMTTPASANGGAFQATPRERIAEAWEIDGDGDGDTTATATRRSDSGATAFVRIVAAGNTGICVEVVGRAPSFNVRRESRLRVEGLGIYRIGHVTTSPPDGGAGSQGRVLLTLRPLPSTRRAPPISPSRLVPAPRGSRASSTVAGA